MPSFEAHTTATRHDRNTRTDHERTAAALQYAHQAQRLGHLRPSQETRETGSTQAVQAKYITPLDPVIELQGGKRLPTVPAEEAEKLNSSRAHAEDRPPSHPPQGVLREGRDGTVHGAGNIASGRDTQDDEAGEPLQDAVPPSHTNPLFPPLPMYGPPSPLRTLQCWMFRASSAYLSFLFLMAIVIGALVDGVPRIFRHLRLRATFRNPQKTRPFYEEELKRRQERRAAEKIWIREAKGIKTPSGEKGVPQDGEFVPTEGGPDPLCVDLAYYARRVGLDAEVFEVQTEDGFIIELWHVFNPREYVRPPDSSRAMQSPDIFTTKPGDADYGRSQCLPEGRQKYPVLMMHGLLQSAGAFCTNDDDSLAFYLAKSGYDVWLGNNRCGFTARHTSLTYDDPRMWAWNIRQMGVMDLPALISRVLAETGFPKLALIAHSQGTTQTFVALAKEQRPEIGEKISVFCALAPAVYAGPLIGKMYFRFMQLISPAVFRLVFGIHSFIPFMLTAHEILPARLFGLLGYYVFSFLFSWSDTRWDRDLRERMFQWAPVYVSAESMRWWLGRECFARQRCILATRKAGELEDREDEEDDEVIRRYYIDREPYLPERRKLQRNLSSFHCHTLEHSHHDSTRGRFAWYDDQFPPLALWVCGADDLVDGRRLLRRFDRGREPHVQIVHKKIIEGYEHLDVIWAMDAIEKVGKEVREVIWRTADAVSQRRCRVPVGCERPLHEDPTAADVPMVHSGGRSRMASISEAGPPRIVSGAHGDLHVDASRNPQPDQQRYERSRRSTADAAAEAGHAPEMLFADIEEKGNPLDE